MPAPAEPLAVSLPRRSRLVGALLAVSLGCNLVALVLPFVVIDAAGSAPWIYGLFGTVQMLWQSHMHLLAILVFTFSVIFPFAKLVALGWLWWHGVTTPGRHELLARVEKLGKWSLFDIFLIAIMIALTNDQWLISSASLPGLAFFLLAVVLGMLAGEVLTHLSAAHPHRPETAPPPGPLLACLVVAIGGLLATSLVVPFIVLDDWRLSDRAFSLLTLVPALWQNQSPMLAVSLGLFLIVTPVLGWALAALMTVGWWRRVPPAWLVRLSSLIGRWSMLPVFALSLMVFLAEGHRFLGTKPLTGVWVLVATLVFALVGQWVIARHWGRR